MNPRKKASKLVILEHLFKKEGPSSNKSVFNNYLSDIRFGF